MMKKRALLTLFLVLALLGTACNKSASTAPTATPEGASGAANQLEAILNAAATQTAAASGAGPETGGGANETSEAAAATATVASGELATATPTVQPTKPPVDLTVPDEYTLREGEFPYCIARRFNISATDLLAANGLSPNGLFQPGLKLTIPKNAGEFDGNRTLSAHPTDFTVRADDTFYSIACVYGDVWPEEIAAANNTTVNADLNAGDVIKIP